MRDAKLTFLYPNATVTATSGTMGSVGAGPTTVISGTTYNQGITYTQAGASAAATNLNALELNYGGLLINGVSGAVLDNDMSGSVDAADYVRGQILNPIYIVSALTANQLAGLDVLTCEVHTSNTLGFTPSASTVVSTNAYTPPAAFTVPAVVVTSASPSITLTSVLFVTAINPTTLAVSLSATRGGGAITGLTSVTVSSIAGLAINQTVTFSAAVNTITTGQNVILSVYNDVNSTILSVPLQSYGKFLRVRWVATTVRSGVSISVTRTAVQTGRESCA
jgi:hypothetical protein